MAVWSAWSSVSLRNAGRTSSELAMNLPPNLKTRFRRESRSKLTQISEPVIPKRRSLRVGSGWGSGRVINSDVPLICHWIIDGPPAFRPGAALPVNSEKELFTYV